MTDMMYEDLEALGLSKNETQVYLELLRTGKTKAGALIKSTGLHRNLVYQALEALATKRLLTKTTSGTVSLFQPTDPMHLLDTVHEQQITAQRVIAQLKEKQKVSEHEMTIYEGDEGVRAYNLKNAESLKPGEYISVIGSGGPRLEKSMGHDAVRTYFDLIKRNGGIKVLMYQTQQYTPEMRAYIGDSAAFEFRILPLNMTPAAGVIFTRESVGFVIYEPTPIIIEVKNPLLVEAYTQYFDMLWNQEVFIDYGAEAIQRAFRTIITELEPGQQYYSIGSLSVDGEDLFAQFFAEYHRERIQKGIECFLVAYKEDVPIIRKRFHEGGDPEEKISHIRPLIKSVHGFMQVLLHNSTVTIPLYGEKPMVLVIRNQALYDGFKQYFEELWNPHTITLEGQEGVERLCEMVLREKKDMHLIAANGAIMESHPSYYREFTKERVHSGIHMHVLANASIRGSAFTQLPQSSVRYLPKEFESPMVVWVFGEYVANVLWNEPQKIFITHDAKTADAYRQYYCALEKSASA